MFFNFICFLYSALSPNQIVSIGAHGLNDFSLVFSFFKTFLRSKTLGPYQVNVPTLSLEQNYQHFNFLPKTFLNNYSAWEPSMRQPNIDLSLEQWLSYHRLSKLLWQKNQIGFRMPVKSDLYSRKLDSLERKDSYLDGGSKIGLKGFFIYILRRYCNFSNS